MDERKSLYIIAGLVVIAVSGFFIGSKILGAYYINQGKEAIAERNYSQARSYLIKAVRFDKKNPIAYAFLARTSLGIFQSPVKPVFPALGEYAPVESYNYYPNANYDEAIDYYEKAIALGIAKRDRLLYHQAIDNTAYAYWRLGNREKSIEKYREEIAEFPGSSFSAKTSVAFNDFNYENNPQESLEMFTAALQSSDANKKYFYQINTYIARLHYYFSVFPEEGISTTIVAEHLSEAERYAKVAIEQAAESNTTDLVVQNAYLVLALVNGIRGNFATMEQMVSTANQLSGVPSLFNCTASYGYLSAKKYERALDIARESIADGIEKYPYPYSLCVWTLGESNYKLGNLVEAEKYYSEYLQYTENNKNIAKNIFVTKRRMDIEKRP